LVDEGSKDQLSDIIEKLAICQGQVSLIDLTRLLCVRQARRFLGAHAAVSNLFNLGRHLVSAEHYRNLRTGAFCDLSQAVVWAVRVGFSGLKKLICQNPLEDTSPFFKRTNCTTTPKTSFRCLLCELKRLVYSTCRSIEQILREDQH